MHCLVCTVGIPTHIVELILINTLCSCKKISINAESVIGQIALRIFEECGLMKEFNIPKKQFLNYMHALELGYRNKPCKYNIFCSVYIKYIQFPFTLLL